MNYSDTLIKYIICYCIMFIITGIAKSIKSNRLFNTEGMMATNINSLIGLHFSGILWLGLIPIIVCKQPINTIIFGESLPTFLWTLIFIPSVALLIFAGIRSSYNICIKLPPAHTTKLQSFHSYFFSRVLFLFCYELFFRGVLLFNCISLWDNLTAIIITTALTILIHVFTNKKEMLGCIPYGIITSLLCIAIHAIWPAIVLHCTLSFAYEIPPINHFLKQQKLTS